jgi:hypothetical protein
MIHSCVSPVHEITFHPNSEAFSPDTVHDVDGLGRSQTLGIDGAYPPAGLEKAAQHSGANRGTMCPLNR